MVRLLLGQGGRRLIEDDQASRLRERGGDGNQTLLGGAEHARRRVRPRGDAEEAKMFLGECPQLRLVHESEAPGQHAHEHVLRDAQTRRNIQFLRNEDDTGCLRVAHRAEVARRALDQQLPLERVGRIDPRYDLHQGRFASAVLADNTDGLAGPDDQVHIDDRLNPGERLADVQ